MLLALALLGADPALADAPPAAAPVEVVAPVEVAVPAPAELPAAGQAWSTAAASRWADSVVKLIIGDASCSGVVIDEQGTVATAYHCAAASHRLQVSSRGGVQAVGQVLATSHRDDLALVSVPGLAGQVPPRPLRSTPLQAGEAVLAIGHPFGGAPPGETAYSGTLSWSLSQGIVSAVGTHLVQTDAALNPGSSGGPVFDAQGRVIGIVSRKLGGEGVAFLSPVERLRALVEDPHGAHHLGGDLSLGLQLPSPIIAGGARSVGLRGELDLRERVVLGLGVALPIDARTEALAWGRGTWQSLDATLALRQRLGSGSWSTSFDMGGALVQLVDTTPSSTGSAAVDGSTDTLRVWTVQRPRTVAAGLSGRVGLRGLGLRMTWLPGASPVWIGALELRWPGMLGTF